MISRLFGSLAIAAVLLAAGPVRAQDPPEASGNSSSYLLQRLKEWGMAAAQHEPGKTDPGAEAVGGWSARDLEVVVKFLVKLASQPAKSARRVLSRTQIQRLLGLTEQEVGQGDIRRILKQGALLHTDIALLGLDTRGAYQYTPEGIQGTGLFADGRVVFQPRRIHWEVARMLIDALSGLPSQDQAAREWYVATTAHMQSRRLLGYAGQNLKYALEKFPNDEKILFYAGVLHETWASPLNQVLISPKVKTNFGSRESELKLAREFFRKAIKANPNFAEARLRLGRVTGLLGGHADAADELRRSAASIQDPQLRYYAALYLGCELEMLLRTAEAREQYEQAAMLYPAAQSPLLALSQLARAGDDIAGAQAAVQRVFDLPHRDAWQDDPYWVYDIAHVRDSSALVAELYKTLGGPPR